MGLLTGSSFTRSFGVCGSESRGSGFLWASGVVGFWSFWGLGFGFNSKLGCLFGVPKVVRHPGRKDPKGDPSLENLLYT